MSSKQGTITSPAVTSTSGHSSTKWVWTVFWPFLLHPLTLLWRSLWIYRRLGGLVSWAVSSHGSWLFTDRSMSLCIPTRAWQWDMEAFLIQGGHLHLGRCLLTSNMLHSFSFKVFPISAHTVNMATLSSNPVAQLVDFQPSWQCVQTREPCQQCF